MIGARLAAAGTTTSALARGATLEALQDNGWQLHEGGNLIGGPVVASNDPADLGQPDVVVLAVKAQSLAELAPRLAPLIGPHTVVRPGHERRAVVVLRGAGRPGRRAAAAQRRPGRRDRRAPCPRRRGRLRRAPQREHVGARASPCTARSTR